MTEKKPKTRPARKKAADPNFWELKMYVNGKTSKSVTAIDNLKMICEEHLKGRYRITVVDLSKNPDIAFREQIIATPTLIRELPPPLRKIVGDLSRKEKVLIGLDLLPRPAEEASHG